ncbi:MAG: folate family ECF transporter S component [Oscillospiraceae bacterium]|nr:folate family ECF transporter S component [Oscillospiraceae bacterium]
MSKTNRSISTKSLVCCAVLAALSIVMARLLSISMDGGARYSLDKFPLFLAGMLFGPLLGGMTGFAADFLGSLMQFGFNPILCPPAILYGVFGGLMRNFIMKKPNVLRLGLSYLLPIAVGSILYQSIALSYVFPKFETLQQNLTFYLSTRSVQFSILLVAEVFIIYTLIKMRVFTRLGIWPAVKNERKSSYDECQ